MEDFAGGESENEDLFSDDDGSGKDDKLSPNVIELNTQTAYLLASPVFPFHDEDNIETPGKPVIPKTPLSLVPFMTKEKSQTGWTSDLETPVTDRNNKKDSDNIDKANDDDYHQCTPKNAPVSIAQDEVVPGSPVVSSKKSKRRTKRRIFNKDIMKNSTNDDTIAPDNNSNKENSSKKININLQVENVNNDNNIVPEIDNLIKKYEDLRNSSTCFNSNNKSSIDHSNDICNDIFVNNLKALDTADKIHCKTNKKNLIVLKKSNEPQEYVSFTKICQDVNKEASFLNDEEYHDDISNVTFSTWDTYQSLEKINKSIDDDFLGFTKEDQSKSQNLLLKFERLFQFDKQDNFDDTILLQKNDFNDVLSCEKISSDDEPVKESQENCFNELMECEKVDTSDEPVVTEENKLNKLMKCEKVDGNDEPVVTQENDELNELMECEKIDTSDEPVVTQKNDFNGFLKCEKEASSDIAEKIRLHYESYVDKISEKSNIKNRIYLEPQPIDEPILLPPIAIRIKSEFINAHTKKELLVDLNRVNDAWSLMTYEYNIDKLIYKNSQPNLSLNITDNFKSPSINYSNKDDEDIKMNSEFKTAAGKELIIYKTTLTRADSLLSKNVGINKAEDNLNQAGIAAVFAHQENFNKSKIDKISNEPVNKVPDVVALMAQPIQLSTFETSSLNNNDKKKTVAMIDTPAKAHEPFNNKFDVNISSDKFQTPSGSSNGFSTFSVSNSPAATFTWGHGKSVNISEKALALAAKQFNDVSEEDSLKMLEKKTINNSGGFKNPLVNRTPGGFISHRKTKSLGLMNDTPKSTSFVKTSTTPSGFSTCRGKTISASKNSLLKAQANFNNDNDDKINQTKLPLSNLSRASTSGGFGRATSKLKLQFNEDFSDIKNVNITTPTSTGFQTNNSCFTTAKGNSINLSENVLLKAKSIFNEDDLDSFDESCLLDIKNLKKKIESRSAGICDSAKRKMSLDDITPFGRKRSRLGTSTDLQARKLFDETDQDDCQSICLDSNNKNKSNELNDTLTDELSAATAAFEEDDKHSTSSLDDHYDTKTACLSSSSSTTTTTDTKNNEKIHKTSLTPNYHDSIPDDFVFDTQYSFDEHTICNNKIDKELLSMKIKQQENIIKQKKITREKTNPGYLLKLKLNNTNNKIKLENLSDNNKQLPLQRSPSELEENKIDTQVLTIDSTTASSYKFNLTEFNDKKNTIGIDLNDGVYLLPNDDNIASIDEFKRSFLASPGVDTNLLPNGWFENHYKWIIWKLASMDRLNFNNLTRSLTPQNVMGQLKYRYDREIDRSERSPIRKIMEKDDVSTRRMVLCVSRIITTSRVSDSNRPISELELTDGWYSIIATIDSSLNYYVNINRIKIGTKLMIYGGQLLNLDDGTYPLDASNNVRLKISANSTRRAKWYTKLGYQLQKGPMTLNLKDIKSNGGLIGKIIVTIARVYPLLYREKLKNGETIYRNSRCEEKAVAQFEKECQTKIDTMCLAYQLKKSNNNNNSNNNLDNNSKIEPRNVSPCLKLLITDGFAYGIMTIWSSAEECSEILKETSCIEIINSNASGMHSKELQLTSNRWTTIHEYDKNNKYYKNINFSIRCFTPITEISSINFSPAYNEFDTIGIVVSIGPAPHGMKNFETMNIAYKNNDNIDSYLSILFWQGISAYGYSEISNIGSFLLIKNLQWRRNTNRSTIPVAFCTERTVISKNSRQINHLRDEFDAFIKRINDTQEYIINSADKIRIEIAKKTPGTTPIYCPTPTFSINKIRDTPEDDAKKKSIKNRIDKLKNYGPAPSLSPINITKSSRVSLDFRSPIIENKKFNKP
ncbi:hypothetical protein HCN44_001215 [Aphidius gifuensis]|uniref:Breast cancer type 2 susceptibility protein n=1 Tax=Aphidius gifuensis TaxID=684658 RepID=A0A834XN95_APHGI|nr:uncharacterized protein MAL13P1.304-like [Aphidius gifuensis]KAF7988642.1 hypothetical protein HCN44_001215 [Aphidius gifuensis]